MATKFAEPGSDATFGLEFYATQSGDVSSDSGQAKTGPRSIKCVSGVGGEIAHVQNNGGGIVNDSGTRLSFYVRFTDLPTGPLMLLFVDDDISNIIEIYVTSAGVLQLRTNGVQIGSDGSTLSTGTWYRLSLAYTVTSPTVNESRLYLDGVLDISVSNASLDKTGSLNVGWGWITSGVGNSKVIHLDDLYIDDDSSLTDTGDIRVTAKLPTDVNNDNFDTSTGSGAVNERPIDDVNNIREHAASSDVAQDYNIEAASAGDEDISGASLVARVAWVWADKGSGPPGGPDIINNGVATPITLQNAPPLHTNIVDDTSYPTDAATIGMRSTGAASDTFFYESGMILAYKPAARRVFVT